MIKGDPNRVYLESLMTLAARKMYEELQKPPPFVPEVPLSETEASILDVLCEEGELFTRTISERSGIANTSSLGGVLRILRDRGMIHSRRWSNLMKWSVTDEGRRVATLPQPWALGA